MPLNETQDKVNRNQQVKFRNDSEFYVVTKLIDENGVVVNDKLKELLGSVIAGDILYIELISNRNTNS